VDLFSSEPAKMTIENMEAGEIITVSYNPTDYSLAKGAQIAEIGIPGLDSPLLQFIRGTNERLTLRLFFDTTDDQADVREKTEKFYQLAIMDSHTHAVPRCMIAWGESGMIKGDNTHFIGIVENINQNFTLFNSNGIPLRAELEMTFREYRTLEEQVNELHSYTRTRSIKRGDTLSRIAAEEYKDPGEWRIIAEKNNITDPKTLTPGQVIEIPPFESV
jgi:nucleoid-associated protein YgaU